MAKSHRLIIALTVGALISYPSIHAQTSTQAPKPARLVFSPIPILSSGSTQSAPTDRAVAFFDTVANQVLLQTPATTVGTSPTQMRYDIPNGAHPALIFLVNQSGAGPIQYTYSLTDDPTSPQGTQSFHILLPSDDTSVASSPSLWAFIKSATSLPDRSGTTTMGTMSDLSWQNPSSTNAKVSGVTFVLTSTYLPGFASGSVAGFTRNPLTGSAIAWVPDPLKEQLQQFLEPGIGQSPYLVIAPLFKSAASKAVIAANFHFGVSALIRNGLIDGASPYATALLQALSTFLQSGGAGQPTLPTVLPATSIEKAIQGASIIALQ